MSQQFPSSIPPPADIADAVARLYPDPDLRPRIVYFPSVTSTNDLAARLADRGEPELTAVVSEQQTAGRGRLGRSWFSPPGAGLYVSVILRPGSAVLQTGSGPTTPMVTLAAGVAFAEAVRLCTHLPVTIKWPNDLMVEQRKLAGILTETSGGGRPDYLVVGFGLNVRSAAYPADIADRATSVEAELGRPVDRGPLLVQLLASLASWIDALRAGRREAILDRWRSLSPSARGAEVEWAGPEGPVRGTTDGVDRDGALLVRIAERVERIIAGEVTWL